MSLGPQVQFRNHTMGSQLERQSQVYICWSTCLLLHQLNCFKKIADSSGQLVQICSNTVCTQVTYEHPEPGHEMDVTENLDLSPEPQIAESTH